MSDPGRALRQRLSWRRSAAWAQASVMHNKLCSVPLAYGRIKELVVLLGDDDRTFHYQLIVDKPLSPTGTMALPVDITEQQATLMLTLAKYR